MNLHYLLGYPLAAVAGLEILLGTMLLRQNPRNSRVNKAVAAFSFSSAAFSLSVAIMYLRAASGLDHIPFARLSWVGWYSVPAALQVVFYLRDEGSSTARQIGWVLYPFWTAVLALCLFTDLIVTDYYRLIPFENHSGPVENPVRFIGGALIVWLMIEILRLRAKVAGVKRAQLNYFFVGTLIFATCGSLSAGFLQLFGGFGFEPGLASYFSFPWVVMTFYAISRFRLFDMRIIISNALGVLLLFVLFAGAHAVLFSLLAPIAGNLLSLVLSLFLIVLFFFGTPLSVSIRAFVRRTVLQDAYLYQDVLREATTAVVTILDFSDLMEYIVDTIRRTLQTGNVSIYLKNADGRHVLRHASGYVSREGSLPLLDQQVVEMVQQSGRALVREEFERILPEQDFSGLNNALRALDAEVVVPLRYKGQMGGILIVGAKGNGGPFVQSDVDLLDALAGHAAIAIENARLYDDARRAHDSLQESEARLSAIAEHSIRKYLSQ